ncbi:hypothetical protein Y032_0331g2721 [Ancylostoma ceylanicum]|uniref:Uncharacterized protein n=1 Tax=Ancylostoma ceylanicum TaxID=53326 RepID=A0A016S094_9BILA|nr:hypothetical protein Y032_0331g2721 [Ancylostoma ceylanicum]
MPASYSSAPISGFTGHIPGAKWQVGSRYVPPTRSQATSHAASVASHLEDSPLPNGDAVKENRSEHIHENESEAADEHRSAGGKEDLQSESGQRSVQFSPDITRRGFLERNEQSPQLQYPEDSQLSLLRPGSSEMSIIYNSEGFPVRIIKNNQVLHTTPSDIHSLHALSSPGSEHLRNGFPLSPQPTTRPPSVKQRARSLPRRTVEKDPFDGLEGGWWSKGEVQRNKERREMANNGKSVSGGDWSQRPETPKRQHQSRWRERDVDVDDIPAAGYSGHMPGLRQLGVGKSFNTAAREAKRDYAIRRRALSGDRVRESSHR